MNTLQLNSDWDLFVDSAGNIAMATGGYAVAQDVASQSRLFSGELWYDITQGIPYFQRILGYLPSLQFLKSQYISAALSVPGVQSAKCFLTGPGRNREVGGQIQITDTENTVFVIETTNLQGIAPWYVNSAVDGAYTAS